MTVGLKINLIYDYRQQATEKLSGLGIVVDDNQASYDSLKVKFEALKKELAHLTTVRRREVAEKLEYAKSLGDLSENSEYQEARETKQRHRDVVTKPSQSHTCE